MLRSLLLLLPVLLGACVSPGLQRTVEDVDILAADISAAARTAPQSALAPQELLSLARSQGPDFQQARISRARARIALDGERSTVLPKLSLGARQRIVYPEEATGYFGDPDLFISIDWDLAATLFYFDYEDLGISEAYIPIATRLQENAAARTLLTAYLELERRRNERRVQSLYRQAAICRDARAEAALEAGEIAPAARAEAERAMLAAERKVMAADRAVAAARRQTLFLAGVAEDAEVVGGEDPSGFLPTVDPEITRRDCYIRSGVAARDDLLLAGAAAGVKLARLERYGRLEAVLPAAISNAGGLKLDFVVAALLPLIDQGAGERRVQEARLALLELALESERARRAFDMSIADLHGAEAAAAAERASARNVLDRVEAREAALEAGRAAGKDAPPPPADPCLAGLEPAFARLALERAEINARLVRVKRALLCAPAPDPGIDTGAIRDEALAQARTGVFDFRW